MTLLLLLGLLAGDPVMIKNPEGPGKAKVVFEEELRFGGIEHDNVDYEWFDGMVPVSFDVDKAGNIYIIDPKTTRLLVFNKDGSFDRVLAKQGQGPGEYSIIANFDILADGTAIGREMGQGQTRLFLYDKEKNFVENKIIQTPGQIVFNAFPDPLDRYFSFSALKITSGSREADYIIAVGDKELKTVKKLVEGDWLLPDFSRMEDSGMWSELLAKQFSNFSKQNMECIAFLEDGHVLMLPKLNEYRFEVWSSDLKTLEKVVTKEYKGRAVTDEQRAELEEAIKEIVMAQGGAQAATIITDQVIKNAVAQADLPTVQNAAIGVLPLPGGGFFVVTDGDYGTGELKGDFFDKSGKFIASADLPGQGMYRMPFPVRIKFTNTHLYAMERNEDGDNQMVRYRYKIQ